MEREKLQLDLKDKNSTELYFELYVNGEKLDINSLTEAFGFLPTEISNEEKNNDISFNYWRYTTNYIKDIDVNFQLSIFVNQFKNQVDEILQCCSKGIGVDMGIYVVLFIRDDVPIINISRENIQLLAKLNCMLQFDIYDFR